MSKRAVVLGAGGFIGGHLVRRLMDDGYWVRGADIKRHEYDASSANEFMVVDLRHVDNVRRVIDESIDEVYQLAADMGGAEYIFSEENDADIMHNSVLINLNVCNVCAELHVNKVFYSSSACVYPEHNQTDPNNPDCTEGTAYPAAPDSEYGWEKLFSERLFLAFAKNKGIDVRIARFHNIYGPMGTWTGGREKAPAAMCRKVLETDCEYIEVWGDGLQTRSFLYIDECIEGIMRLMHSTTFRGPVNIGSDEMVSINTLARIAISLSGKPLHIHNVHVSQIGVRGRNSNNALIQDKLVWSPHCDLATGMQKTFAWIKRQHDRKGDV